MRNHLEYLIEDWQRKNVVKLEFKTAPYEVVGMVDGISSEVGPERTFTISSYGEKTTRLISDILYYRLA